MKQDTGDFQILFYKVTETSTVIELEFETDFIQ